MLLTKTVMVKWHPNNKKHYETKGYKFTKIGDEFEVKVEDLTDGSHAKVDVKCDCLNCKNPYLKPIGWQNYKRYIHENGKYYCRTCSLNIVGVSNIIKTKLKNTKSFYDWCYDNLPKEEADKILNRWDYKLNQCSPKNVTHGSKGFNKKGYWFKCPKGMHESELKNINDFTSGHKGVMDCKKCNSFAQWGIDNLGENFLEKYWDYEKNDKLDIDPWEISLGSGKNIWIKCQEKNYHESYSIKCPDFIKGVRCSYCGNFKVHPLDSLGQYVIDNYGQEFLDKIWSDKNKKSPFEFMPFSIKEVYWKCLEDKHKDYKRKISTSNIAKFRCPKCVQEMDESMIQNKTRLYLESLNCNHEILHEHNCTLIPINPKTKHILPFDNEIISIHNKHLIIEVNGIQHYELGGWHISQARSKGTMPEYEFHMQKVRDRYKRFIAYKNGYEYLELPYWVFDKQDTYKKLIDNKINEILNKENLNLAKII